MLLKGLSHMGIRFFSKISFLPPFLGQKPRNFASKIWIHLHYSSPSGIPRGQKAEIWHECCLGGHLIWVKRIFRKSHFYPLFGAKNTEISPRKCNMYNKPCSISESLGLRKLKFNMRGDYISISKCAKGFFEIHIFTPFLGPKPPKFCFKNVEFRNTEGQQ